MNKSGSSTLPWGTPTVTDLEDERLFPIEGDLLAIVHITKDVLSQMRKGHLSRQVWAKTKLFRGQRVFSLS